MKTIIFLILLTTATVSATDVITASKLSREFQVNELRANANYKNKVIIIKGKVKKVQIIDENYYWIVLKGDSFLSSVYILFPTKDHETLKKASKLKSDDFIAIKALVCEKDRVGDVKCNGDTFISAMKIEPIKVEIKPIKVTNTIKAVELSREFQDNVINAGQNFENQEFDIIGTVERIKKLNNKSFTIELKGCSMYNLVCIRFYNNKNLFKKACELIPSDFIRVRAICIKYDYSDVICSGINFKKIRTEEEGFNQRTLGESKPIEKEIKPFEELPKYGTITLKNGKEYYGELIERTNEGITIKTELFKAFYKWDKLSDETVKKYVKVYTIHKSKQLLPVHGIIKLKNGKQYIGMVHGRTDEGIAIKTPKIKAFYKWKDLSKETVEKYKLD